MSIPQTIPGALADVSLCAAWAQEAHCSTRRLVKDFDRLEKAISSGVGGDR